ncbi:MAG: M14 family zinc carboxypeptidase [Anaerolineaceae bacterium]|nr:M14 family zinc carboxypeptidase [Anaerolineaceae bacterium]
MDLKQIASHIPEYESFPTIDEQYEATRQLASEFPDLVSVETLGETRAGEPLEMFSIGEGESHALVFGGPHPCEPVGCLTIDFLSRHLCENEDFRREMGYQWHFIRCLDIDGMRLNEGWFQKPRTPLNYYRHMFRPLMNEQPEMLFPIEYKSFHFDQPFPETSALKKAIDRLRPKLMLSLHNAEFGGAYYYISHPLEGVFSLFSEIPGWFDVPLDLGEPDQAGYIVQYAPAIYRAITVRDGYDRRLAAGVVDPTQGIDWGGTSNGYAERLCDTVTLLPEVPYWTDARINDNTVLEVTRREIFSEMIDREETVYTLIQRMYKWVEAELTVDSHYRRAVHSRIHYYLGGIPPRRQWVEEDPALELPATIAKQFQVKYRKEHELMRMRGMFLRMLDEEVAHGNDHPSFHIPREIVKNNLHDVATALQDEIDYIYLPIRNIVGIQLSAGLATAAVLNHVALD